MARSIRIEYPKAFYHVMARGNRREAIFLDDGDRGFFLKTLGEGCAMTGWRVHAWVLMTNHYHLLLETPEPNLIAGMTWFQNTYTRRFNTRNRLWGRLFGDRYKAVPVEGSGYYYETLLDYIHLNPVRAGLVKPEDGSGLLGYPWSSVTGGYALLPARRPRWLAAADGLAAFGYADTAVGRRGWVERLERRAREEEAATCGVPTVAEGTDARVSNLQRGWYWGTQEFAERLLTMGEAILKKPRHSYYNGSQETQAHGEAVALKLLEEGLAAAGLTPADLRVLPGSDARKVEIAMVIWHNTVMKMQWIADHLGMRTAGNVCQQIRRYRRHPKPLSKPLESWIKQSRILA